MHTLLITRDVESRCYDRCAFCTCAISCYRRAKRRWSRPSHRPPVETVVSNASRSSKTTPSYTSVNVQTPFVLCMRWTVSTQSVKRCNNFSANTKQRCINGCFLFWLAIITRPSRFLLYAFIRNNMQKTKRRITKRKYCAEMSGRLCYYMQQRHSKLLAQFAFILSAFHFNTRTNTRASLPDSITRWSSSSQANRRYTVKAVELMFSHGNFYAEKNIVT